MPGTTGFYELYRDAPAERREWLRSFRLRHPRQHFTWHGTEWEYIASEVLGDAPRSTEHWVLKQNHRSTRDGDGVVVLGGATSTAESSFDLISALEQRYRFLSPSYPPVGTVGALLDGLVALLDAVGLEKVNVFGHSMGAGIGHVLVRRYPERVDKLVLSSFGLYGKRRARRTRFALGLFRLLPYGLVKRYYARRLSRMVEGAGDGQQAAGTPAPTEAAFMTAYLKDLFEYQHTKASLLGQLELMADLIDNADTYDVYEPIERPGQVLIMQAKDDTGFKPDEQAALRETYPGAQIEIFDRGGHSVRRANQVAYDNVLFGFLGE